MIPGLVSDKYNVTHATLLLQLSSVGGTMLWVKADVHRDGVVFPTANIVGSEWERQGYIGLETEGICWMAQNLDYKCWGMPRMIILHSELQ